MEKAVDNDIKPPRLQSADYLVIGGGWYLARCATIAMMVAAFALVADTVRAADTYTYNSTASSTWLNGSNWTGGVSGHFPGLIARTNADQGTNTDIAIFASVLSSQNSNTIGINMNSTSSGANQSLTFGTIEMASNVLGPVTINNSSTTLDGVVTLTGNTINNVASTIFDNESTKLLTIANGSNNALGVGLSATTSVIQTNGTGGITISSIISGIGKNLTFQAASTGQLALAGANTFSGTFTASSGTVTLGGGTTSNGVLGGVSGVSVGSGAVVQVATTGFTDVINNSAAVTVNGTLDLTGGTETIGSLAGTSTTGTLRIGKYGTTNAT